MNLDSTPVVKDLVLVGGGHSHVTVLKRFGMSPMPGVRLTLICRDVHTPYSGMLPGLIAGHYEFDEAHIDLGPLARFAGARLYHDEVMGIDLEARRLACRGRPPVPFDIVSINTGSTPGFRGVASTPDAVVPVKPINNFLTRWEGLEARVAESDRRLRIATVGAGAGGVELTLAAQHAFVTMLEAAGRPELAPEFHVLSAGDAILPTHNRRVRSKFRRVLRERGIALHTNARVARVDPGRLELADGSVHEFDEVLWVTQASAPAWIRESGLDVDEGGFARVRSTLESISHPGVFAAGDVAAVVDHPREKAGVFAVRQGPPLELNLRQALLGEPLIPFTPQKRFLSLISTGDRYAVASRTGIAFEGAWVWRWKDWIDRRFMKKFNELPAMSDDEASGDGTPPEAGGSRGDAGSALRLANEEQIRELSAIAMRCSGCGAKVGATVLSRVMAKLEPFARDDVLVGLDSPDDAAVIQPPPGKVLVQTVDSFRAIVDDPFLFGRIAANHALSDVFAMGATPQSALAVVTIPFGIESKVETTLEDLLRGALVALAEAETSLVGGHTSEGAELSLGFAVTGFADPKTVLGKGGMRPGEALVLTKALGTGTLFAAEMRLAAKGRWIAAAIDSMLQSNERAADCLRRHGASALTDVTGFGLLGHLAEMTRASGTGARLDLDAIPALDGALECIGAGIMSSLQPQNLRLRRAIHELETVAAREGYPLIFDPQTSGGLLASVPAEDAGRCVEELRELGYARSAIVGEVEDPGGRVEPIRVA